MSKLISPGEAISAYMKAHELTQEQFAKQVGVTQGAVSMWLKGATTVAAETAVKIEDGTAGAVPRHVLRPDLYPNPTDGLPQESAA